MIIVSRLRLMRNLIWWLASQGYEVLWEFICTRCSWKRPSLPCLGTSVDTVVVNWINTQYFTIYIDFFAIESLFLIYNLFSIKSLRSLWIETCLFLNNYEDCPLQAKVFLFFPPPEVEAMTMMMMMMITLLFFRRIFIFYFRFAHLHSINFLILAYGNIKNFKCRYGGCKWDWLFNV